MTLFRKPAQMGALLAAVSFLILFWLIWGGRGDTDRLVVYCAHDSVYSQEVLDRFSAESGIEVDVKFDTEATKSLGLVELISNERDQPRCDVFWNNEVLGTVRLADSGCLEKYESPNASRFSPEFKDPSGLWTGFAGRVRVILINLESTQLAEEHEIAEALESDDLSKVAIANPLYGTTLTHYAALWNQIGEKGLQDWHHRCRNSGMIETGGNAAVKELVARGVCHFGFTDTDDAFLAIDAGYPVSMIPARLPSGQTICIPNTVSMIKNCPNPESARLFVDFLLSEESELALARGRSRQIPLGTLAADADIPPEVGKIRRWTSDSADLKLLAEARNQCLAWLKSL